MSKGTGHYRVLDELIERVETLVARDPTIPVLELDEHSLFQLPGFRCADISPTPDQVKVALAEAQERHRLRGGPYKKVPR